MEFSTRHVRELKGAPLAILVLLAISPLPVSKEWLARSSGYTDKPIHQACSYLKEQGLIDCSSGGWFLAAGFQMPLPGRIYSEPEGLEGTQDQLIDEEADEAGQSESEAKDLHRKISDQGVRIINKDSKDLKELKDLNNNKSRKNSEPENAELWEVLREAGVRRNERTMALARLEHVTPEYLRAKMAEYKASGLSGAKWAGLFIRAIEAGEPAPERSENGHFAGCECVECQVNQFFRRVR